VWLGGPKSKRGGGYLWIIENKKNAQLWNIIMEWEEVSNEMSKELELLHKRIAVLESEFKSSRISNN
jgi:hypothetical protein